MSLSLEMIQNNKPGGHYMKPYVIGLLFIAGLALGQTRTDTVDAHVAAAKAAARQDHLFLFNRLCTATAPAPPRGTPAAAASQPAGPAERSKWHAEPAKVFDNLYFLGQTEYSAWAVNTSEGIIIIDAIFDYSVEDEVVNGLTKLGLDPK